MSTYEITKQDLNHALEFIDSIKITVATDGVMLVEYYVNKLDIIDTGEQDEDGFVLEDDISLIAPGFYSLLESVIVTKGGNTNYNALHRLGSVNIKVYAGESDSFGWLTAIIESPKGKKYVI